VVTHRRKLHAGRLGVTILLTGLIIPIWILILIVAMQVVQSVGVRVDEQDAIAICVVPSTHQLLELRALETVDARVLLRAAHVHHSQGRMTELKGLAVADADHEMLKCRQPTDGALHRSSLKDGNF